MDASLSSGPATASATGTADAALEIPGWADDVFVTAAGQAYFVVAEEKAIAMRSRAGSLVGWINWSLLGVIGNVHVSEEHRRRGVATELQRRARLQVPGLQHSKCLSSDARAWIAGIADSLSPGLS